MAYKNNRNSREDKSLKHKSFEGSSKKEQPEKPNSEKKKMFGDSQDRPFRTRSSSSTSDKKSEKTFGKRTGESSFEKKPYRGKEQEGEKRPSGRSFEKKPFSTDKKFEKRNEGDRPFGKKTYEGRERSEGGSARRSFDNKTFQGDRDRKPERPEGPRSFEKKPFKSSSDRSGAEGGRPYERKPYTKPSEDRPFVPGHLTRKWTSEDHVGTNTRPRKINAPAKDDGLIRLNRYIANAGICSRRKADELIEAGVVSVNGETVSELGFKVDPAKDVVRYNGETLRREKMIYVVLNKPKDYITTTDDPQERRTVMQLVEKASRERIYPVGRLDRNTTGLLLMTNDGDLADKLSHPRNNVTKIYNIELNKNLTQGDFNKLQYGVELEDGLINPDVISYVTGGSKREVGVQIHSGKNRIVRRMFEHLGYEVVKLDRVVYANLTKKDLPRGRWRFLDEKEIIQLKHLIK